jgi:hypothetical protein
MIPSLRGCRQGGFALFLKTRKFARFLLHTLYRVGCSNSKSEFEYESESEQRKCIGVSYSEFEFESEPVRVCK